MALWDIIEAIFNTGKEIMDRRIDETYKEIDKMESTISRYEKRAARLSDSELREAFEKSDGTARVIYGRELKNRGY